MKNCITVYPGFSFLDEHESGDYITILARNAGRLYSCSADQSYDDENGNFIEQYYEECYTENELCRKLRTKHICWRATA